MPIAPPIRSWAVAADTAKPVAIKNLQAHDVKKRRGAQPRQGRGTRRDVLRDAGVEALKGKGVKQRRERRRQHWEPPHGAGVAPSPAMRCDRHDSSLSVASTPTAPPIVTKASPFTK